MVQENSNERWELCLTALFVLGQGENYSNFFRMGANTREKLSIQLMKRLPDPFRWWPCHLSPAVSFCGPGQLEHPAG